MTACNVDVIKLIGKYYNVPVGTVCYNTDKVLTTVLDKENVEGFATIVLRLASKNDINTSQEQVLQNYQWLEHIAMYANQAASNPSFAKLFLEAIQRPLMWPAVNVGQRTVTRHKFFKDDINKALEKNSYLTGQQLTVTDVAAYYVLYPLLDRLSILDKESLLHVCRWSKHIQAQPKVCTSKAPIQFNTLALKTLAPASH